MVYMFILLRLLHSDFPLWNELSLNSVQLFECYISFKASRNFLTIVLLHVQCAEWMREVDTCSRTQTVITDITINADRRNRMGYQLISYKDKK